MNEADRREKTMLDLFDWITDFVAGRDDVTADDIRLAIAREFADGPRERDALLAQYRAGGSRVHESPGGRGIPSPRASGWLMVKEHEHRKPLSAVIPGAGVQSSTIAMMMKHGEISLSTLEFSQT